jgi:hypothetical protein
MNSILVSISSALIFGHGQPRSNQPIPPGGYEIEPVAQAATLVSLIAYLSNIASIGY